MPEIVNYAVTGCGFAGRTHARIISEMPKARLVAAHSRTTSSAHAVQAEVGGEVETDLEAMVRRADVDALIVATPNNAHRNPVALAAKHGKHVLCEKPLATSVADARAIVDSCRDAGVTLMVGHMMHFYPGLVAIKERLDTGALGRPLVAHVERTGWEPRRKTVSWKKMQAQSGGHLFHHIHEIDVLIWLLGAVDTVFAAGGNLAHLGEGYGDEDDVLLLTMTFASGAYATMQYGSAFRWAEHLIKLNTEAGAVFLDNKTSSVEFQHEGGDLERIPLFATERENASMIDLHQKSDGGVVYGQPTQEMRAYLRTALENQLALFNRILRGEVAANPQPELAGGAMALHAVEVAAAALRSKETGRVVRVGDPSAQ